MNKGFLVGVAVTAPLTAVVLYLVLTSRQDVRTSMEHHAVRQEIQQTEFDRDFNKAWSSLGAAKSPSAADQAETEKRLAELRTKKAQLEERKAVQGENLDRTIQDLDAAMREAAEKEGHSR